jgi:hypothetical protein
MILHTETQDFKSRSSHGNIFPVMGGENLLVLVLLHLGRASRLKDGFEAGRYHDSGGSVLSEKPGEQATIPCVIAFSKLNIPKMKRFHNKFWNWYLKTHAMDIISLLQVCYINKVGEDL